MGREDVGRAGILHSASGQLIEAKTFERVAVLNVSSQELCVIWQGLKIHSFKCIPASAPLTLLLLRI